MNSTMRNAAVGLAIAALGFSTSASAATATATAHAEILASLTVTATDNSLDFGSVANNGTGGTVAINPATGARNCASGLVCSGASGVAAFHVVGEANLPVGISFTNTTFNLQGPTPADTMPIALLSQFSTLSLSSTGVADFNVGGTITVAPNQAAGAYQGTLEVVVLYN